MRNFTALLMATATLLAGWMAGYYSRPAPDETDRGKEQAVIKPAGTSSTGVEEAPAETGAPDGADASASRNAIASALQIPRGIKRQRELLDAVSRLRVEEMPAMIEMTRRLRGEEREQVLELLGAQWAELDPAGLMNFAAREKDGWVLGELSKAGFATWVARDQRAAVEWALAQAAADPKSSMLNWLMGPLAARDFAAARALFDQARTPNERYSLASTLAVSARPGRAVVDFAALLPPGENRDRTLSFALRSWTRVDPQSALAWAGEQPAGTARNVALADIVRTWADKDPRSALDTWMAREGAALVGNDDIALRLLREWNSKSPEEAETWSKALPRGQLRNRAVQAIIEHIAYAEPERAIQWVAEVDPEERVATQNIVARMWARREPEAALQWLASRPEGPQPGILGGLVGSWASKDPVGAARWVDTLPLGASRDSAASALAFNLINRDPASGAAWLTSIGEEKIRQNVSKNFARQWLRVDAPAARTWIENNPDLSAEARAELLNEN